MLESSYNVGHSWGDPREPEYRNGSRVSYAHYSQEGINLYFSIYPHTPDDGASMVMEVPATIRILLNNDWSKCEIVIRRVLEYLESLEASSTGRNYAGIVVDASQVPGWFPTQIALLERNHPFLIDTLPSAKAFPLIVFGAVAVYQYDYFVNWFGSERIGWVIIASGVLIMGMLFADIYQRWTLCFHPPDVMLLLYKWTFVNSLRCVFSRYWRRFIVTFCISLIILGAGLKLITGY